MASEEKMVLDVMQKEGKPMKQGEIAERANMDEESVSRIIDKLKKEGMIKSPKQRFYSPA